MLLDRLPPRPGDQALVHLSRGARHWQAVTLLRTPRSLLTRGLWLRAIPGEHLRVSAGDLLLQAGGTKLNRSFQEGCSPLGFAGDGLKRCSVQQPAKVGLQPFLICQLVELCLCRPSTVVPAAVGSTLVAEFLGNVNEMKHELEAAAFGASTHGHGSVPLGSARSSRGNLRPLDRTRGFRLFLPLSLGGGAGAAPIWRIEVLEADWAWAFFGAFQRPLAVLPALCGLLKDTANRSNIVLSSLLSLPSWGLGHRPQNLLATCGPGGGTNDGDFSPALLLSYAFAVSISPALALQQL